MSSVPVSSASSRYSWRRVLSLAAYYRPMIEKQTLVYLIASIVFAILTLLPVDELVQIAFFTIIWTLLPYMTQFAPCLMAKSGDARIVERLIPATAAEKFTFRILYFLIVIPMTVYALPYTALYLYQSMPALHHEAFDEMVSLALANSPRIRFVNLLSPGVGILMCLYTVSRARHNRVLKGVVSVFAVQLVVAIIGAIWGAAAAFNAGFCDGFSGIPYTSEQIQARVRNILEGSWYMWGVGGLLLVWFIVMLVLNYRILKRQNL